LKLNELSATALVEGFARRAFSPLEVMRDVIARVEAYEPHIHAAYLFAPERALAEAEAATARWANGAPKGPLDGVPVTVKDNIATKGEPKPVGAASTDLAPQRQDAPPAARLREAGAIIFSKTTMPDYGMLSSGLSSFHALARNPWDLTKGPGGSSAGAAAAGAAGYGPLHLGTDIGGSIRLPAGWCGLVGLKPSAGRVPIDPPFIGRVAGPLTRTAADAALMMATLSLPDTRDYTSLPEQRLDWRLKPPPLDKVRIGLALEIGCGETPRAEVRLGVERAARDFAEAGAVVEPLGPMFTQAMLDGLDLFWRTRSLVDIDALSAEKREKVLPFIRAWAESARGLSGETVYAGFGRMQEFAESAVAATSAFDYVLTPTAPHTAFPAEMASPSGDPLNPFPHIGFTVGFNMSGQPAVSINCGFDRSGLPIGLQIVGRRFDDVGVLAMARAYEEIRSAEMRPWPQPPGYREIRTA
jgi:Asp-tRNA(Asn)/Glu-tRNA(Gln) amidotransferase A subunit family amidase